MWICFKWTVLHIQYNHTNGTNEIKLKEYTFDSFATF